MSNRILRDWVGRGTYSLVISKTLNALVVILQQVLMSSVYPSSNGFWSDQHYPRCNYLDRAINKLISNQYSKKGDKTWKSEEHQRTLKEKA
jgi:hypothetical protein